MDLGQLLLEVVAFINSVGGMSVLAIAAGAAQLLVKIASSSIGDLAGKYKLLIVSGVSVVSVVLGGLLAGAPLFSVLLSGAGLAALQVFLHQIYTQFFLKAA
jgi:hypothetical protein